jgi:hypothetical protein
MRSSRTGSPRRLKGVARLGPTGRVGHRSGDPLRPRCFGTDLRRRPRRGRRSFGPHPIARREHGLPDADLPGPVQPPLRRLHVRLRRPAAGRRRCPETTLRRAARAGHASDRGHHHQPRRGGTRVVRRVTRDVLLGRRGLRVVVRRKEPAEAQLELAVGVGAHDRGHAAVA